MARKSELAEEERLEAKKRRKILASGWSNVDLSSPNDEIDPNLCENSKIVCTVETEDLYASLPGRRSFGGFNSVVERYYQSVMDSHKYGTYKSRIEDENVSNEEMLSRYQNLIGLPTEEK